MLKKNNGMKMTDELTKRMQVEKLEEIKRKPCMDTWFHSDNDNDNNNKIIMIMIMTLLQ